MIKNSFYMGIAGIFVVFLCLLFFSIESALDQEDTRPKIYSCFVYDGNLNAIRNRLEVESKYIDHFVILEKNPDLKLSSKEKKELIKDFKSKLIYITTSCPSSSLNDNLFSRTDYLKGLEHCQDKDVILFSKSTTIIDQKVLYQNLNKIEDTLKGNLGLKISSFVKDGIEMVTYQNIKGASIKPSAVTKKTKTKTNRIFNPLSILD